MKLVVLTLLSVALQAAPSPILGPADASVATAAEGDEETTCCLVNPRYAGVCREECTEEATCEDILAYLNNPMSVGKRYCGETTIRGGWELVDCDAGDDAGEEDSARRGP